MYSIQFNTSIFSSTASYYVNLDEVEAGLITYALRKHGGNMSAVALQLGVSRQTLYNKMKKYGI